MGCDPGSEILDPEKTYSGSRIQKGTGSQIRIHNTGLPARRVISSLPRIPFNKNYFEKPGNIVSHCWLIPSHKPTLLDLKNL
jgi:hypothetical protein